MGSVRLGRNYIVAEIPSSHLLWALCPSKEILSVVYDGSRALLSQLLNQENESFPTG